jgi:hypothetical protein
MADSPTMISGSHLIAARAIARLTQRRMARELGVYEPTLVDAENDRLPIGQTGYAALVQAYQDVIERLRCR